MKSLILAFALSLSTSAFARQYIQCSASQTTDVAVINLTTANGGTLFISSGMQNPEDERAVVQIKLDKVEAGNHVYKIVDSNVEGQVVVPSKSIGKASNYLAVDLDFAGYFIQYSCFSAIYND